MVLLRCCERYAATVFASSHGSDCAKEGAAARHQESHEGRIQTQDRAAAQADHRIAQLQPVQTIDDQLSAFDPVTWVATTAGTMYKDKMPEKDTNGAWRNPDTRIAILVRRPTKLDVNYVLVTFKANINYDDAVAAAGKMPTVIQELRMDKNTYARCVTLASRDDALKMYGKPHPQTRSCGSQQRTKV